MRRAPHESPPRFRLTPHYLFTVVISWLLPGAGHWILGFRVRGVLIGATLLGTFWFGEAILAENMAVTRKVHPIFFGLQAGNGFSALLADTLWGAATRPARPDVIDEIARDLPARLNLGILLCSVSGLLNVLVILHVMDPRTWQGGDASNAADEVPDEKGS